ncbi:MAG: GNAT family N-acetyltransferase [Verrucomicrobia bacterium]|nr:GNAT family N-acetyltransferase [Verrucomicrobiota bacterium]MCF7708175.1 GNAT family N-acetyltransferase [Verrucomicrobiota bacterium]
MQIRTISNDDFIKAHQLAGECELIVQHPIHLYRIMQIYFGNSFFIAEDAGEVAGFLLGFISQTQKDVFFVWQVGVSPRHRRKGIAASLVKSANEFAKAAGCTRVHSTVETGNSASQGLFERLGFANASFGETIEKNGKKAMPNYYGSGTDQILYELAV